MFAHINGEIGVFSCDVVVSFRIVRMKFLLAKGDQHKTFEFVAQL